MPTLSPLPLDAVLPDIRAALDRSRAAVIVADPGAGKTTRVPPALIDSGPAIVLQPRRSAARAIARRIAEERGWRLGHEIGWHIRFERNFSAATRLLIATEGILTARLQGDPLLSDFTTVVLDEFHERSIHADLAIALAKQAMLARDDLRLVVMSATIDADRVAEYLGGCPIIRVPGHQHPLVVEYLPDTATASATARALQDTSGDVLCFQPGAAEIARAVTDLRAVLSSDVEVVPLHGGLSPSEQDRALTPTRTRRVVVCTNIAETSLTVPRVHAVVDTGLEKVARFDVVRGLDSLVLERASQASVDQRAGRAARLGPGRAYRLWSRSDKLKPFREPDIHRIDLAGVALDVLGWGGDPGALQWFDPPRAYALDAALAFLRRIGATDHRGLTQIGRAMLRLPLPPRLSRIVIEAGGHPRAVRAAALLAERVAQRPGTAVASSDLLPLLDQWEQLPVQFGETARQIARVAAQQGTSRGADDLTDDELRRAVLAGYPDRVAMRREPHSRRFLLSSGTGAVLSPESAVRDAAFIVALDVQSSSDVSKPDGRISRASAIEREWLVPTVRTVEHVIDDHGRLRAREVVRYDALRLAEHPVPPDPDVGSELLATAWLERPPGGHATALLRRLAFAGCEVDLPALVRSAAYQAGSVDDIDIHSVLGHHVLVALERDAPERLPVPSGRTVALEYADDGTVTAAVKLQELFGLADTPRVGPKQVPVLLALLAPNGRPVQLTRDLRSFWERTYPEVRKELRGRYPKHPWPENPWAAAPTHRTKPRG